MYSLATLEYCKELHYLQFSNYKYFSRSRSALIRLQCLRLPSIVYESLLIWFRFLFITVLLYTLTCCDAVFRPIMWIMQIMILKFLWADDTPFRLFRYVLSKRVSLIADSFCKIAEYINEDPIFMDRLNFAQNVNVYVFKQFQYSFCYLLQRHLLLEGLFRINTSQNWFLLTIQRLKTILWRRIKMPEVNTKLWKQTPVHLQTQPHCFLKGVAFW